MSNHPSKHLSRAPLFRDAFELCEWLLGHFGDDDRVLAHSICSRALSLLEAITLALKDRAREEQIDTADELLIGLRLRVRLAAQLGYVSENQAVHALERTDTIGNQLGGWLRSLGPV
ncbi:MAG: four helix bundle protein [Proteobacteria bacterium]|nr:four helix bundle protein [Pseudomonadota bacterium]